MLYLKQILLRQPVVLTTDMPIKGAERFEKLPKIRLTAGQVIKSSDAIVAKVQKELG